VGEFGYIKTQRLIHQNLAGRIVNMVVATNYMGDFHQRIIDNHSKVVGRITIAAFNDQVIEFVIIKTNIPFD
jgi:hypothetical protein